MNKGKISLWALSVDEIMPSSMKRITYVDLTRLNPDREMNFETNGEDHLEALFHSKKVS